MEDSQENIIMCGVEESCGESEGSNVVMRVFKTVFMNKSMGLLIG